MGKHRVLNHNQTTSNLANGRENILATPKKIEKCLQHGTMWSPPVIKTLVIEVINQLSYLGGPTLYR